MSTEANDNDSPDEKDGLADKSAEGANLMGLAAPVSSKVQIDNVSLFDCIIRRERSANLADEVLKMAVTIPDVTFQVDPGKGRLLVTPVFSLFATRNDETDAEPILVIDATFDVTYTIADLEQFSDDNFDAFARINGVFNVWPYWRELVQSLTARMGLRPVILPVFRV